MAGHVVSGAYLYHAGIVAGALANTLGASLLEVAVLGHINRVRHVTGDVEESIAVRILLMLSVFQI